MKTKQLIFALFTCFISGSMLAQTSGGPDTYGYTWKNSDDAQGPAYNWIDIKATGTQITGLKDDNVMGPFDLGWNFHYYWADFNKVWVADNGYVAFQNVKLAASFQPLPWLSAKNTLAPMMCDLTFSQYNLSAVPGATAWYWTNNLDTLIIQHDSVPYYVDDAVNPAAYSGRYTFQIILSGADSSVVFQYKLTQAGADPYDMAGEGLYTGIENSTGQIALQVLANVFPTASTAVKFYYPNPVTYQVFDATPAWNQNTRNGGFFVSKGTNLNLVTDIENAGNQPLANIASAGLLLDVSSSQVWNSSLSVSALAAGDDTILAYPTPYNANTAGSYLFRSTTTVSGDMNPANDIRDVEMVVVDTSMQTISLSYTEATTASQSSGWGGNGGQGIYIEPPFYPAIITSLDFMVTGSGTAGYHLVQIVDDDGLGNSAGTVLYLDSVAASAATLDVYNNVPVTTPVAITSGGVYVGWFENGDNQSSIGTDASLPLSYRNYELLGGAWSSYRNNSVDDIMIKVNIQKYWGPFTTTVTADSCPSDSSGTATANISGGTPPYSYMWSPSGQTTSTATGLWGATYTVTITDSLGISTMAILPIYNAVPITVSATPVSCFGGNNGTAAATISGTLPYTYMWSPGGQTTQTATGLSAGIYTITASNADGCMNVASDTVISPAMIASTFSTTAQTCAGNDGTATATVTGGTGAYTYSWNPSGQTAATAIGLSAGTYTLTITDANGCTSSSVATITSIPFNANVSSTPVSCTGGSDGTTTATVTGGTGAYTYSWNPSGQTAATAIGLSAGTYTVTITDANGCTSVATVTLTDPTQVNVTAAPGAGIATASPSGGTGPYSYSWSPGGQITPTATGLAVGTYTVCVTDSKGCSACNTVTVIDGAGINEIYSGASLVISPNPFTNSAHIKIDFVNPAHNELMFTVYDIYGRTIQSIDLNDMSGTAIDFTLNRGYNIPNGLYFYKLTDHSGILSTGKLIVQ